MQTQQADAVRGFYLAMELIGWYVILPSCVASLVTGVVMSLATPWGLFRHYWVLVKFLITIVAALILFGFTQTLGSLGHLAADPAASMGDLHNLKQSPVLHSGGGLVVLLLTTILAVYKPWGLTPYGRRKQHAGEDLPSVSNSLSSWKQYPAAGGYRPGTPASGSAPSRRRAAEPLRLTFSLIAMSMT